MRRPKATFTGTKVRAKRKAKHVHAKAKRGHAKPKARVAVHRTKKPALHRSVVPAKPAPLRRSAGAASVVLADSARGGSNQSVGLTSLLIVLGLLSAIACFTIAVVPATSMRWRPAVIFASERHVDLTVAGIALLTLTAFIVVVSKGF